MDLELKLLNVLQLKLVMQKLIGNKLTVPVQTRVVRLSKKLNEESALIEEQRIAIIKKHGSEKYLMEDGENISIPEDSEEFALFKNDYLELLQQPATIEKFKPFTGKDFEKIELDGGEVDLLLELGILEDSE